MTQANSALLPWQYPLWQQLQAYRQQNRLPQALLLSGQAGWGKRGFADAFVAGLICQQPTAAGFACGGCEACVLRQAGNHPDLMTLMPEEPGKAIVIDSVRQVFNTLALKPLYAAGRWVLVQPAEALNAAAANCFLKGLEEPPERTAFILMTAHPQQLPATVRSRCQAVRCDRIDPQLADHWLQQQGVTADRPRLLQLAQGSPQRALAYAQGDALAASRSSFNQWLALADGQAAVPQVADQWQQDNGCVDLALRLQWLSDWLTDVIKLKLGVAAQHLHHPDVQKPLQALAERLELQPLFRYYDAVTDSCALLTTPVNKLLATEALLLQWSTLTTPHHG